MSYSNLIKKLFSLFGVLLVAIFSAHAQAALPPRFPRPPFPIPQPPKPPVATYTETKVSLPTGYTSVFMHDVNHFGVAVIELRGPESAWALARWSADGGFQTLQSTIGPGTFRINDAGMIAGAGYYDGAGAAWLPGATVAHNIHINTSRGGGYPATVITSLEGLSESGLVYGTTYTFASPVYFEDIQFPGVNTTDNWVWSTNTQSLVNDAPAYIYSPNVNSAGDMVGQDGNGSFLQKASGQKTYLSELLGTSVTPSAIEVGNNGVIYATDGTSLSILSAAPVPEPSMAYLALGGVLFLSRASVSRLMGRRVRSLKAPSKGA